MKLLKKPKELDDAKLRQKIMTLQPMRIFKENRCLKCFKEAADMVDLGQWKGISDRNPRKMWYQILDDENKAIEHIFVTLKPHPLRILEVGCGPGRVIDQIVKVCSDKGISFERIFGIEQNHEIYLHAFNKFQNVDPNRIVIMNYLFGENDHYSLPFNDDYFDLAIAVSNLVGWQNDEAKWINEVMRVSKKFFFTVYKREFDTNRMRMYEALGDAVEVDENENIWINTVDAFRGKKCITKSYTNEDIVKKIEEVSTKFKIETQEIRVGQGQYMYGFLLKR